jgi:hypothetical protein
MSGIQEPAESLPIVWVVTVCPICGANVYTGNLEGHTTWHRDMEDAEFKRGYAAGYDSSVEDMRGEGE